MAVVVLPTPPFWFAIAITCVTGASPRNPWRRRDGRRSGGGTARCYSSGSVGERRGYPQIGRLVHHFVDMSAQRRGAGKRPYHAERRRADVCLAQRQGEWGAAVPTNDERISRLAAMRQRAQQGGGQVRIDQQHARGKLTA